MLRIVAASGGPSAGAGELPALLGHPSSQDAESGGGLVGPCGSLCSQSSGACKSPAGPNRVEMKSSTIDAAADVLVGRELGEKRLAVIPS